MQVFRKLIVPKERHARELDVHLHLLRGRERHEAVVVMLVRGEALSLEDHVRDGERGSPPRRTPTGLMDC